MKLFNVTFFYDVNVMALTPEEAKATARTVVLKGEEPAYDATTYELVNLIDIPERSRGDCPYIADDIPMSYTPVPEDTMAALWERLYGRKR